MVIEYTEEPAGYGEIMPVEEFIGTCRSGFFIDYDGFGEPLKNGKAAKIYIKPSRLDLIPDDATHIQWFNR